MDLKYHFIVSSILTILLYPIFGISALLIFIGGFLIDIDHLLWYILKYKDFNIKNTFIKSKDTTILYKLQFFHLLEILLIVIILSFYSTNFLIISIGLTIHQIMDF